MSGEKPKDTPEDTAKPTSVLESAITPQFLVAAGVGEVKLTFVQQLDRARVKFEFSNKDLRVTCNNESGTRGIFEHDFRSDARVQRYEIKARTIKEESSERVEILFLGIQDDDVLHREAFDLSLKPKIGIPDKIDPMAWLRYLLQVTEPWPKWIRRLVALVFVVFVVGSLLAHYDVLPGKLFGTSSSAEPAPYEGDWTDHFNEGERPDPTKWRASATPWTLERIAPDSTAQALKVSGDEVGLIRIADPKKALVDCCISFRLLVTKNQRSASWVLRARNELNYYLFTLTFPTASTGAKIKGAVYENGKEASPINGNDDPLDYQPFDEGDVLKICIEVKGQSLKHTFQLLDKYATVTDGSPIDPTKVDLNANNIIERAFSDPRYRYGAFGFKGGETGQFLKILQVEIGQDSSVCERA